MPSMAFPYVPPVDEFLTPPRAWCSPRRASAALRRLCAPAAQRVLQTTYALVVVSAIMHAYWNFLIKRSGGTTVFVGLSKIAEVVVYAPAFVVVAVMHRHDVLPAAPAAAMLIVVGAALTLMNYLMLSRGYARGALSVVYPLSRGAGLLFLPALGF